AAWWTVQSRSVGSGTGSRRRSRGGGDANFRVFIAEDPLSGCLLKRDVALQKEVEEIVADVGRLALFTVALRDFDYGLRKPVPRASVLDQVVEDLVQGLPAGFLHALLEPAPR